MNTVSRKADTVIRWLERMKSAYACGAVESAYLDAECARADLETLRTNIFAFLPAVKPRTQSKFPAFIRGIILSFSVVMAMTTPLSRENFSRIPVYSQPSEILTVKEEVSSSFHPPKAITDKPKRTQRTTSSKRAAKLPDKPKPEQKQVPSNKQPAYDKLHILLETGRRALKTNNTVIKIK